MVLEEPLIPSDEAAAIFKVAPKTMVQWRHRRYGPAYVKIGGLVFYRPSDIRAYIASRVVTPQAA
jgi:predicted DNA-binding transcriptional regulator AlpA